MNLADKMRKLRDEVAYDQDSPIIKKAFDIIMQKVEEKAREGKSCLIYFFDGLGLDNKQQKVVARMLEDEGFKYRYEASQDPGHPCDRPLDELTW